MQYEPWEVKIMYFTLNNMKLKNKNIKHCLKTLFTCLCLDEMATLRWSPRYVMSVTQTGTRNSNISGLTYKKRRYNTKMVNII